MRNGFIFTILLLTATAFSAPRLSVTDRIDERMKALDKRLNEIRSATVLRSDDAASIDDYFIFMIRQNKAIQKMTRIGPDGAVLNVAGKQGPVQHLNANVSGERWFKSLIVTRQPYTGTAREKNGNTCLFRAWPIEDGDNLHNRIAGVVAIKIDIDEYLSPVLGRDVDPIQVRYNKKTLFSRNWSNQSDVRETLLLHAGFSGISVRFQTPVQPTASSIENGLAEKAVPAAPPVTPVLPQNTMAPVTEKKPANTAVVFVFVAVLLAALFSIIWFRWFRSNKQKRNKTALGSAQHIEPINAILLEDEIAALSAEYNLASETKSFEVYALHEQETKILPAIKDLIAEASKQLQESIPEVEPTAQDGNFCTTQGDLIYWVASEISHLSGRLSRVVEGIRTRESLDGTTPELQELRQEMGRILDEISRLQKRLLSAASMV